MASKDCTVVRGTEGVISNPRTFDCMFVGGCYEPNKHHCWKVVSDCKTIKVKFDKFIVEEYLSTENTCPYDKVQGSMHQSRSVAPRPTKNFSNLRLAPGPISHNKISYRAVRVSLFKLFSLMAQLRMNFAITLQHQKINK